MQFVAETCEHNIVAEQGNGEGNVLTHHPLLPVITMPTSKFHISFTLMVLDAAELSTHEFILDLGPGNGASGTLGASEACVTMGHLPALHPSASPSIQSLRCTHPIPQM